MVLRLVQLPLESSASALAKHIAHLQDANDHVLLITNRIPAAVLLRQLDGVDWNRLALVDTVSPSPTESVNGVHVEHVAGPHLLELLQLRIRRLVARLPRTPHIIYYDAHTLSMAVPRLALEEMTRQLAMVSPAHVWTEFIVHTGSFLPGWQRDLYDEVIEHRCLECDVPSRLAVASP